MGVGRADTYRICMKLRSRGQEPGLPGVGIVGIRVATRTSGRIATVIRTISIDRNHVACVVPLTVLPNIMDSVYLLSSCAVASVPLLRMHRCERQRL